jgi:hypothetical protein
MWGAPKFSLYFPVLKKADCSLETIEMVIKKHCWAQFSNDYVNRKLALFNEFLAGCYYIWV